MDKLISKVFYGLLQLMLNNRRGRSLLHESAYSVNPFYGLLQLLRINKTGADEVYFMNPLN